MSPLQRDGGEGVAGGAQHQLRTDTHPKPLFHHGQCGKVIIDGVTEIGPESLLLENEADLQIPLLRCVDIGILPEPLHGIVGGLCQRVIQGKYRHQLVSKKGVGFQPRPRGQSQKAAVCLTLPQQILHLRELPVAYQVKLNTRVAAEELLHDSGQPVDGHAGEGGHPQGSPGQAVELRHLLLQLPARIAHRLNIGQQRRPAAAEHHPRPAAGKKLHVPLPLQIGNHTAHRRLGIPQRLRRTGDAPQLHSFQQNLILVKIHNYHSISAYSA